MRVQAMFCKYFTWILLGLLSFPMNAQNYQNICSEGETYFGKYTHYLLSFRNDSIEHIQGSAGDSIIWSFPTIQNLTGNPTCYDINFGSILGRKIIKKADGTFIFFNLNEDSIVIQSQATLNQSWKCVNLSGGNYILATITGIQSDTIIGVADSIKVITLQAKDSVGQIIPHDFNGKQIKLSKSYGFIQVYQIVKFPEDTACYYFEGKTSPSIGYQDFSFHECYDFDIGDEFHYDNSSNFHYTKTIKILLEKYTSSTGDTVTFRWERCYVENTMGGPYIGHDTIWETISPQTNSFFPVFTKQPYEYYPQIGKCHKYIRRSNNYHTRSTKRFEASVYYWDSCWKQSDYDVTYHYSSGLGRTTYRKGYWYEITSGIWVYVVIIDNLVYYSKGNEIWGIPHAPDCWTLTSTEDIRHKDIVELNIKPNPIQTQAEIFLNVFTPDIKADIFIYDYFGREIFHDVFDSNPYILIRNHIPSGVYIVRIMDKLNKYIATEKVIFD